MMNRRTLNKSLGAVAGALLAGGAMVLPTSVLAAAQDTPPAKKAVTKKAE